MVYYPQFSPSTKFNEKSKLWDPVQVLEIINPDKDCQTCVGYAPTQGRRCRNAIRADNRAFITKTLDEIAYLSPDNHAIISKLRIIAGTALCVNYHQDQAETVVLQWQRKIQQLKPRIRERKPPNRVHNGIFLESAQGDEIRNLKDQLKEIRSAMARMQEEIERNQHQAREAGSQNMRAAKAREDEEHEDRRRIEARTREERKERERLEQERENERLAKEKREKEEKERLENERLAKEAREKEEEERRKREYAASNERIRQRV